MRTHSFLPVLSALAVSTAFLLASPAMAEVVKYKATLDGSQQSPPVTTKGKGTATFTFDTTKKKLSWNVKYSGLSGPATAAQFMVRRQWARMPAPVIPFKGKLKSPIKGSAELTDAQAADLAAGNYYVNVHTAANKDGEIRGQIEAAK